MSFYYSAIKFFKKKIRPYLSRKWIDRIKPLLFYLKALIDIPIVTLKVYFLRPKGLVLLCCDSPSPIGGTELQVHLIAAHLKKWGFRPLVVTMGRLHPKATSPFFQRLKQDGIVHLHLGNIGLAKQWFFEKYKSFIFSKLQANICHCFNPKSTFLIHAAKEAGLKIIYSETGLPSKDSWWQPIESHIHQIPFVIAISMRSLTQLQSEYDYRGAATVLRSLIYPPEPHVRARPSVARELHIVYFGRLYANKGIYILLHAFHTLLSFFPHAHLTFMGEGPEREELEREMLAGQINQVVFLPFKTDDDFYRCISQFDVMCLPSFAEGTPCSILEAMSIGLAVVATNVGGIPELIEHEVSGLLIPPHDKAALVGALTRLALNPSLRAQMADNGLKRYKKDFAPEHQLSLLRSIYCEKLC